MGLGSKRGFPPPQAGRQRLLHTFFLGDQLPWRQILVGQSEVQPLSGYPREHCHVSWPRQTSPGPSSPQRWSDPGTCSTTVVTTQTHQSLEHMTYIAICRSGRTSSSINKSSNISQRSSWERLESSGICPQSMTKGDMTASNIEH